MHIILTRVPRTFSAETFKAGLRKILRKKRGPDAVLHSLERGLQGLDFPYRVNKKPKPGDTVHVLSSVPALSYAIGLKAKGYIKHLVAGPNLVVIPDEHDRILASPHIDVILMVSAWTKDFYASLLPEAAQKIQIWPSGVAIPRMSQGPRKGAIIFKKVVDENIFETVLQVLKDKNIPFSIFTYGKFSQKEYFAALEKAEFMIYLQEVESQGIALQEAWSRDVPTFVWNKGVFTYPTGQTVTGNITAPFLTERSGMFFKDALSFEPTLNTFIDSLPSFKARQYCEEKLSDKASAETYVKILESIK